MISYFYRNRHGAITLVLIFLLISVMTFNNCIMEGARYRSLASLYREIQDNASFSLLAQYQRELYENFGLLGMGDDVNSEKLASYLQYNVNQTSGNKLAKIDKYISIDTSNISVDKLYELGNYNVFKQQINEFGLLRVPLYVTTEVFDIDKLLESLNKYINTAIPFLTSLADITKAMKTAVATCEQAFKLGQSCIELNKADYEYKQTIKDYNNQVEARNKAKEDVDNFDGSDTEIINLDGTVTIIPYSGPSLEEYQNILNNENEKLKSCANSVCEAADQEIASFKDFIEQNDKFAELYSQVISSSIKSAFSIANYGATYSNSDKELRERAEKTVSDMKDAYDDSIDAFSKIKSYTDKLKKEQIEKIEDSLEKQKTRLSTSDVNSLKSEDTVTIAWTMLFDIITNIIDVITNLCATASEWAELTKKVGAVVQLLEIAVTGAEYSPLYDKQVEAGYLNVLHNDVKSEGVASDQVYAENSLNNISQKYSLSAYPKEEVNVNNIVDDNINKSQNLNTGLHHFRNTLSEISSLEFFSFNLLMPISSAIKIFTMIITLIDLIVTVIRQIILIFKTIVEWISSDNGKLQIKQKSQAVVYANTMFSNRTTEDDASRLNGSDFEDCGRSGKCFSMASAEYIVAGTVSEIANQQDTFFTMLVFRMVCNIYAMLSNDVLMKTVKGIGAAGPIGFILAVLMFIVVWYIEAYLDMIFICYSDAGVQIIKTKGYLDFTGNEMLETGDDLKEMIDFMKKNVDKISKKDKSQQAGKLTDNDFLTKMRERITLSSDCVDNIEDVFGIDLIKNNNQSSEKKESVKQTKKEIKKDKLEKLFKKEKKEYIEGLTKANYTEHMMLLLFLFVPVSQIYNRCGDLVTMQMRRILDDDSFSLDDYYSYIRVSTKASYTPLLPLPDEPFKGKNEIKYPIQYTNYMGY